MKDLSITIVHRIPGRIRLRLEKPPRDLNEFVTNVSTHEGIEMVSYNQYTKSLLVYYVPSVVSSVEILVRVSVLISLSYENSAIKLKQIEKGQALTPLDYYAAGSLAAAYLSKSLAMNANTAMYFQYNAGYSTLLAVLRHAWIEIKKDGLYDPEVISVVYLINSLIKGNYLTASLVTWIVTFGRHLSVAKGEVCTLEATSATGENDETYVDVMVRPVVGTQLKDDPIRLVILGLSRIVGINATKQHHSIFEQIQQMSRKHGNILESVGNKPGPVYMRLNQ